MIMLLISSQTLNLTFKNHSDWILSRKPPQKSLLEKGFIRPSKSPQAASLFFVSKSDGRPRPCQDYHYINAHTIKNAYPLPRIDDLIDDLHEYDCFIKMDIRWGYNNVHIKEGDEWKAAFICKEGLFEPLVMFFGLTNSPATFQSMINDLFKQQIAQKWLKVYMDNLLICGTKANIKELIAQAIICLIILEE